MLTDVSLASERETLSRFESVLRKLPHGTVALALRDHGSPTRRRVAFGHELVSLASTFNALVLVHDRVDIARAVGAGGVHLGELSVSVVEARRLMPRNCWISRSCHDEIGLARAVAEGVDAVTLSPLFASPGKGEPLGCERFARLRSEAQGCRVFALGGVDSAATALAAKRSGADGVAVIRAVLCSPDAADLAAALVDPFLR